MPAGMSVRASLLGVVAGFFPIGWIVLNVIFLYQVTVSTGRFELLKRAVGGVTEDRRLQLLLIAFSFGAFFEGASGFGTPVAITGSVLIGLGFSPLAASDLDRLDRAQRHLSLSGHGVDRPLRTFEARRRWRHRGSAAAIAADRVLLRRLLRGGLGLRYPGGDHRFRPDRPRLLPARRFRP